MSTGLIILIVIVAAVFVVSNLFLLTKAKNYKTQYDDQVEEVKNYESIIDQANDAMIVIDIVDGKIHQSNPSASHLLGYSEKELEKLSLFELHPKEFLQKSSGIVADVWEKGGLIYSDIPFLMKNGELLPDECSPKVAPFAGRPSIVIYARDIRERLKMEKEIRDQNEIIEQKNKDITDSINYAKRIQNAIMPDPGLLNKHCSDAFILFKPKDIVSGDFYWYHRINDMLLVAAADCTGHGVPGALMSMIGINALNEIVEDEDVITTSQALSRLDTDVTETLKRSGDANVINDGMDIAFCAIDLKNNKLNYTGANRPMIFVRNGECTEYKPDKLSISGHRVDKKQFTVHAIELQRGDTFYIFTDGYADQFGGEKSKKFMYKNLLEQLKNIQHKNMQDQKIVLEAAFEKWRGDIEQVDDVLIIGVKI